MKIPFRFWLHSWKVVFLIIAIIMNHSSIAHSSAWTSKRPPMSQEEFEARKRGQDQFHALLRKGDYSLKQGDNKGAEYFYLEAYNLSKGSSSEGVAEYVLAKFYKDVGAYEKSLQLVNKALSFLKQKEPARDMYEKMRDDLLQKIEESKLAVPVASQVQPISRISDFHNANYGSQKQFLEKRLPEDTEIRRIGKQALLAEHAGKFKEAKEAYEKMLLRKEETVAAFREEGWVMIHPAVQRTAELTGDQAREKEMLVWIRDNMIAEEGAYHRYLNGLLPSVQAHLKERIKERT